MTGLGYRIVLTWLTSAIRLAPTRGSCLPGGGACGAAQQTVCRMGPFPEGAGGPEVAEPEALQRIPRTAEFPGGVQ